MSDLSIYFDLARHFTFSLMIHFQKDGYYKERVAKEA